MATTLNLVEGGTTTGLNDAGSTGVFLIDYTPKAGNVGDETVTEQCKVLINVGTVALMDSEREEIILRLYNAHARQRNHARDKTYVNFQPDGGADTWRSEILGGKIINETNIHKESWDIKKIEFTIEWTRRNYWEGSEAQVPLTNTNGTDNTAGLNIYNCNDGAGASPNDQVNYCDVKAADVDGELPAAARFEMVNNYNDAADLELVWIGQNTIDPSNHQWWYEGEDATGGSTQAAATSSSGEFQRVSVASGATFNDILTWAITAADVDDAKGQPMKIVVRFSTDTAFTVVNVWFKFQLDIPSRTTVWESERVKPDSFYGILWRDLLTFNFPPWLRGQTGNAAINLVMQAQQETGGAIQVDVDAISLVPVDGWRFIDTVDQCQYQERIVDDGINDLLYIDDGTGADKKPGGTGYGSPIFLEPGKLQRLYFMLHSDTTDTAEIDRYITLKIYYRPRRYTV